MEENEEDILIIEESGSGDELVLKCPLLFEGTPEDTRSKFETNGFITGKIPFININKVTSNKNRYNESCCLNLETDIGEAVKSGVKPSGIWPTLVMYPSHNPAKGPENESRFLSICAEISGTYRDNNLFGLKFETLQTQAGKDMAILMMKGHVKGVSLRGIAKEQKANEFGGNDVSKIFIEGFGADFTNNPAMPGIKEKGLTLENDDNPETNDTRRESMDLDKLKVDFPDLYAEIMEKINKGANLESAVSDLKSKNAALLEEKSKTRKAFAGSAISSVIDKFKSVISEDKVLNEKSCARLLESAKTIVDSAASKLLEDRPEMDPTSQDFIDALGSSTSSDLNARVEDLKSIIKEHAKAETFTEGTAAGDEAPEGNEGLKKEFNIGKSSDDRLMIIESENEIVGLPTGKLNDRGEPKAPPLKDVILAKAFGTRMYETDSNGNSVNLMAKHMPQKYAAAQECQRNYEDNPFIIRNGVPSFNDAMLRQDKRYMEMLEKIERREKMEAGEVLTANLGALFPQIRQGIIEAAFAQSSWLSYAGTQAINSDTYQIWEEDYRRSTDWIFGVCSNFASTGTFATTGDVGALGYADRAYIKITTVNGATDVTFTMAITNQNGATSTASVTVPALAAVGTYWELRPAVVGDRIIDVVIAGAAAAGGTSGAGTFVAGTQVDQNTETTVSGKATVSLVRRQGTVSEMDLEVDLGWRMLEDAMKGLAMHGPGRYDAVSALTRAISKDLAHQVDRRGYTALNLSTNYDSSNDMTLDVSASGIPAGYTTEEYKTKLHETLVKLNEKIADWGLEAPQVLAINDSDSHKFLWMKRDFMYENIDRANAFFSAMSWGTVAGMNVHKSYWQPRGRMMAANPNRVAHFVYIPLEFRGPFSFLNNIKSDVYVARTRSGDVFTKPRTRGKLSISE